MNTNLIFPNIQQQVSSPKRTQWICDKFHTMRKQIKGPFLLQHVATNMLHSWVWHFERNFSPDKFPYLKNILLTHRSLVTRNSAKRKVKPSGSIFFINTLWFVRKYEQYFFIFLYEKVYRHLSS